ncbi:hypothetical protein [Nigerium massiliense]|uniref:hypothetical protein n=1 Tax=Nigerium massiliense TaxID=1522317 RepID=UPI000590D887|nr:hypothetical protein [Nigerium massiliense]
MSTSPVEAGAVRLRCPVTTVWREPGVLQVGLGPDCFVLTGCPPAARAVLAALRHPVSPADLAARHPGVDEGWLRRLLRELDAAGLLDAGGRPDTEVGVIGAGPLAQEVVSLLLSFTDVWVADTAAREERSGRAGRRRAWRELAAGRDHDLQLADHWHSAVSRPADLLVLAPDTVEVDRSQTDQVVRHHRPHLVVTCDAERGIVGPFVMPGETPCLRCRDVTRRRATTGWAAFLMRLTETRSAADPVVRSWAAATAAAQARAFLAGQIPDTVGRTLELSADAGVLEGTSWGRQDECGCARVPARVATGVPA